MMALSHSNSKWKVETRRTRPFSRFLASKFEVSAKCTMHLVTSSAKSAKSGTLSASIRSVCSSSAVLAMCWTMSVEHWSCKSILTHRTSNLQQNYLFLFYFRPKKIDLNSFCQTARRISEVRLDEWRAACKSNFQFLCNFTVATTGKVTTVEVTADELQRLWTTVVSD